MITAWKARHPSVSGHQGKYAMREIVNAILYQNRTGCQWEFLPHDMPPPGAVKYYFYLWRDEGADQDVHDLLRWQLREKRKRLADPSLVVLDTQSIHAAVGVPATTTGKDAAKRVPGRKRCLAVDVLGLVIDCVVLPASAHENTAGIALLDGVTKQCDTVTKALVDQGFKKKVVEHGKNMGIDVEIVERQAEQLRTSIEELTRQLGEIDAESENLRITRKTLLTLPIPSPAAEPERPDIPDHPAYQQILTALTDAGRPMRARDLCQALDLPILPKNTEGIRSRLKRLVSRGILVETEPGLFARPEA